MFNAFASERQPHADNNIINAKLKLNELFLTWLSKQDTVQYIGDLLNGLNQSSPSLSNTGNTNTSHSVAVAANSLNLVGNNIVVGSSSPTTNTNSTASIAAAASTTTTPIVTVNVVNSPPSQSNNLESQFLANSNNNSNSNSNNQNNKNNNSVKSINNHNVNIEKDQKVTQQPSTSNNNNNNKNNNQNSSTNNNNNNNNVNKNQTTGDNQNNKNTTQSTLVTSTASITKKSSTPVTNTVIENNNNNVKDKTVIQEPQPKDTTKNTATTTTAIKTSNENATDSPSSKFKRNIQNATSLDHITLEGCEDTSIGNIQPERKVYKREPTVTTIEVPRFYTPPTASSANTKINNEKTNQEVIKIKSKFDKIVMDRQKQQQQQPSPVPIPNTPFISTFEDFEILIKDINSLPRILIRLLFNQIISTLTNDKIITPEIFIKYWKENINCKEPEEILFNLLKSSKTTRYLVYQDFIPFAKTLLETHPGLDFLKNTPEFQERYTETIIVRIFYINSKQKGRITIQDLKNNNFMKSLCLLDVEPDINKHLEYFSYEHFYVIYCKFWELDSDHDLYIGATDLLKYANFSLTDKIVDRIIDCPVFAEDSRIKQKISYKNFVWFILSEEDKTNNTSLEYWFKCLDFDCDGILSYHEMEYFYNDQKDRLDSLNLEPPTFTDLLCQILDMIKPKNPETITLLDLKSSKLSGYLYNILFNTTKFFIQETKESIPSSDQSMSDWNRFAKGEYERALAEESGRQMDQDDDDDDDDDDDEFADQNQLLYQFEEDDDDDDDDEYDNDDDDDDDDDDDNLNSDSDGDQVMTNSK